MRTKPRIYDHMDRLQLIQQFEAAPLTALFDQKTPAAILQCSEALLERQRLEGTGIAFSKFGRSVRYRKSDILAYLEAHQSFKSTTQAQHLLEKGMQR